MKIGWWIFGAILAGAFSAKLVYSKESCEKFLLEAEPIVKLKARVFMLRSPYVGRKLAMDQEDFEQEFRISAWKAFELFDPEKGPAESYLRHRLNWLSRDLARDGLAIKEPQSIEGTPGFDVEEKLEGLSEIDKQDLYEILSEKLKYLGRTHQRYLRMYLSGMSPGEISKESGISLVRVMKSLQESRRRLRGLVAS